MPKLDIASIGFLFPGDLYEVVSLKSDQSLLDADVVLFSAHIPDYELHFPSTHYQGKPLLSDDASAKLLAHQSHWHVQIGQAISAGKFVVVFLCGYDQVYYDTGKREYHGTGKNRKTQRIVSLTSNLEYIPLTFQKVSPVQGTKTKIARGGDFIKAYWSRFGEFSRYKVQFESRDIAPIIVTQHGDHPVGGLHSHRDGGHLLILPAPSFDWEALYDEDDEPTEEGTRLGREFESAIAGIYKALNEKSTSTPKPAWVDNVSFTLSAEKALLNQQREIDEEVERLLASKASLEDQLSDVTSIKGLLYEQGKPLEASILKALRILGFTAEGYDDGVTEIDALFTDERSRFIGEAEGKDNSAIAIGKLSQLIRNVQDDFAKDEVVEPAVGVLFGNGYRLLHPSERAEVFTAKCFTSASTSNVALVNTTDLFFVAQALLERPDDDYARSCRDCLRNGRGGIVLFPKMESGTAN